jgi:opacity protein-like surface antigen
MRKNLFASALLIVCVTFCLCLVPLKGANSEVEHGKNGLRFTVQGLDYIGLGTVKGGVGFKRWVNSNMALRGDVGFGFSHSTQNSTNTLLTDAKSKSSQFSLDAGAEFHFAAGQKVSPFFGGGINFGTSTNKYEYSILKNNPVAGTSKLYKSSSSSFGAEAFLGVEFFMGKHLSLTGEYDLGLSSSTQKSKTETVGGVNEQPEAKTTYFNLGVSSASLILTVYF